MHYSECQAKFALKNRTFSALINQLLLRVVRVDVSEPLVTITAQQMFETITRMEAVTNKLVDSLNNLKDIAEDHEDRLRIVEANAGAEKRIDGLSERVTQHDAAFTKMSERLGNIEGALESAKSAKTSAVATAVLVSSLASLAFTIVIALIRG